MCSLSIYIVIIFVLPFIITITTNKDFFPVQSAFPTNYCISRHDIFNFSYVIFTSVFLCSLGMLLLMIILFHIQMVSYYMNFIETDIQPSWILSCYRSIEFYHFFVVWEWLCVTKWACEANVGGFQACRCGFVSNRELRILHIS